MKLFVRGILLVGLLGAAGCAFSDDASEPEPDVDAAELRGLHAGELVGSIACGQTKQVHHAGDPLYRALSIQAHKGQILDVTVAAPGHDARAWLTTSSNTTLARNDNAAGGGLDSHIVYTAKTTSTHHVVFRERNYEDDVDFIVSLACSGGQPDAGAGDGGGASDGGDAGDASDAGDGGTLSNPFSASCSGLPITRDQAIAKIGAGNAFREVAPPQKLMARKRSCNSVTGCSPWGAPEIATQNLYMAVGSDNYNRARPYDVHLMMAVQGGNLEAVVEDVSYRTQCAGCSPGGITFNVESRAFRGQNGDATLFFYYPRWTHTSSGFQVRDTWASASLGLTTTASMTVTDRCARTIVLSKNQETEYGVLFRY